MHGGSRGNNRLHGEWGNRIFVVEVEGKMAVRDG